VDAETRKQQARSLEQQGQIAEALAVYRQILADIEGTPAIWQELPLFVKAGDLSLRLRDAKSAITMYEQAAKRYAAYGSGKSVIALCSKILRIVPSRSLIYPRLARLMVERGHVSEAGSVLASYAELAQLDRTARELKELIGRSDDEMRPVLEMLIEVSDRAEQAILHVAAARREQPQAESGVATVTAAQAGPESAVEESLAQHETADEGSTEAAESSEITTSEATVMEAPIEEEPEESSSGVGVPQAEEGDEAPKPAWMHEPEPEDRGPGDSPKDTWMQEAEPAEEDEETPTPEWMREPEVSGAQQLDGLGWIGDGESSPEEAETPKPAWMQEPEPVDQESVGAGESGQVADGTGPRKVLFSEMQTQRRSRGVWVVLAVAVVVVGGAALVWFRIIPIGTIGLGANAPQSEQPAPALADSATATADDGTESLSARPTESPTVAARSEADAEDTTARGAALDGTIGSGDSSASEAQPPAPPLATSVPAQADSGAAVTEAPTIVVIEGLPVESVTEISSEGRAGYRVVQRLDTGEPITLILLSLDGDSASTAGAEEITFESTADDWTVGSLRFGGYLVNASAGVGADGLEVLLRRLIGRPLPD
jgi:hypothetical protein